MTKNSLNITNGRLWSEGGKFHFFCLIELIFYGATRGANIVMVEFDDMQIVPRAIGINSFS